MQVQHEEKPIQKTFLCKAYPEGFSANSLPFAAISGGTKNDPNGLVAFLFWFSSWMKA